MHKNAQLAGIHSLVWLFPFPFYLLNPRLRNFWKQGKYEFPPERLWLNTLGAILVHLKFPENY